MRKWHTYIILVFCYMHTYGQDSIPKGFFPNPNHFTYVDIVYGYGNIGHHIGTNLTYKYKFNLFVMGYARNFNAERINDLQEATFMYGFSRRMKNTIFNISAGIGYNWGVLKNQEQCTDASGIDCSKVPKSITFNGPSFPLKIAFTFTPRKVKQYLGWGFFGYTNINNGNPYAIGGIHISLGKVSPRLTAEQEIKMGYYKPKN